MLTCDWLSASPISDPACSLSGGIGTPHHSFLQESEASHTLLPTRSRMLPTAGMETGWQAGRSDGDCGLLRAWAALKVTALEEPSSCFPREILAHIGRVFWHSRNSDLFTPELSCSHSNRTVSQQDMPGAVENSQSHGECRSFPPLVDQILTHGTEEHTPVLEKIEGNDLCSACW